jgi:hypothetical protein
LFARIDPKGLLHCPLTNVRNRVFLPAWIKSRFLSDFAAARIDPIELLDKSGPIVYSEQRHSVLFRVASQTASGGGAAMGSRKGRWLLPGNATALVLVLFALVSCADVQVVDTTPAVFAPETYTSPLPAASGESNLAVLALDFDPALNYRQLIVHRQPVALLVVIENTGASTERDVQVRAQLSSPEDADLRLVQEAGVSSIAPGEIQIVRFTPLGEIPFHRSYRLEVVVDPVAGEKDLSDNHKAFDVQIHQ